MSHTTLPGTNVRVSRIAMGCWALAGDATWGAQDEADSVAAVRGALDAGINFFDTAPAYGGGVSERRLGRGLEGRRDEAVIATKVGPESLARGDLVRSVERSLTDLGTDHVDLIQIHWPSREVPLEETWSALERLESSGKVGAIGVSNFGVEDLGSLLAIGTPSTNQLPYSMLSRAIEYELVPACSQGGVGVLCYSPLMFGLLAGKYRSADEVPDGRARTRHFNGARAQARHGEAGCEEATFRAVRELAEMAAELSIPMARLALAWLLHQPGVTAVLTGARNASQAEENARAGEVALDASALARLDAITQPVKAALGQNPDLWQGAGNGRFR